MKLSYKYRTATLPLGLLRCIKRRMRWVRAAGGVVVDAEGNRLLILRNGRWDLPKGKVESGESLLQAALREVSEESGTTPTATWSKPLKTYHIYNLYGGWHLKQTSWFAMRCEGVRPVTAPQAEEGIERCEWVSPSEWRSRLQGSYGTLRLVAQIF